MRLTVILLLSLGVLTAREASACLHGSRTFRHVLGFVRGSNDAVLLEGKVVRSGTGCVTHSLELVTRRPDGSPRKATRIPPGALEAIGIVDVRKCPRDELGPQQAPPLATPASVIGALGGSFSVDQLLPPVELTEEAQRGVQVTLSELEKPVEVDAEREPPGFDADASAFQVVVLFPEGGRYRRAFTVPGSARPKVSWSPDRTRLLVSWEANVSISAMHEEVEHQSELFPVSKACRRAPVPPECEGPLRRAGSTRQGP
ncbi:MAG: hypothetical protein MUC96_30170 [Myxococcaceae bacterium]|jgi:hypothetical protein|nr:hypothetical protein [Myxococcaceae bacterium]